MRPGLPQIAKDAQRVLCAIEAMFTRMQRRYRYPYGNELRAAARKVVVTSLRAWDARDRKVDLAGELEIACNELMIELQVGAELRAFGRWAEFEAVARLVDDVCQQSGRWLKSLQSGQNARGGQSSGQRASILSSRSASTREARP